ncbi:protein kinase [bacterium]|nr:protein kinase [bacterium]
MTIAGHYKVLSYVGKGFSGNVAKAQDEKTGQIVALKLISLSGELPKELILQNFEAEFETLKNLDHPHIAKVFDAGFDNTENQLYLVSEFIEGSDLFYATDKMTFHEKENLFIDALRAFNYLHQQSVLHLDIKPQNMLVTSVSGQPVLKIIDFGLANFYQRSKGAKEGKHQIVGTATYLAPEIIQGQHPDNRSDLYALGVSFFKVLTRRLPFTYLTTEEIHQAHLEEDFPKPSTLKSDLPDYIDKIFLKLFSKDPTQRYSSAAEVINDISFLTGRFIPVETKETILSYIPAQGALVARQKQMEQLDTLFKNRILLKDFTQPLAVVVSGKEGVGKSRVLAEIRDIARKNLIKTMSIELFDSTPFNELAPPFIVLADQNQADKSLFEFASHFFSSKPVLIIITSLVHIDDFPCLSIHLENFNKDETRQYLEKATGIADLPDKMVSVIYSHTQGNPAFLSQYAKSLFEKNILRDTHGSWSIKVLDDIGIDLGKNGITTSIKEGLKQQLKSFSFTQTQQDILNVLALTGKPTIEDLMELSQPSSIQDDLHFLEKESIIRCEGASYYFTNPLYAEVVVEMMDSSDSESRSDKIADYLIRQGADKELILYHQGRGKTKDAPLKLWELAQIKRAHLLNDQAINALEILLNKKDIDSNLTDQAVIELAGLYLESGMLENARKTLQKSKMDAQAWELMGTSYYLQGNREEAGNCYKKGLKLSTGNDFWMVPVFKMRMARLSYDEGQVEKTVELVEDAWKQWKELPDDETKIKAARNDIDFIYTMRGELTKAIKTLEANLVLLEKRQDSPKYLPTLYMLGMAKRKAGLTSESRTILSQCLEKLKHKKISHWLHSVYNELGNLEEDCGQWEAALKYFMHAFDLVRKTSLEAENLYAVCSNIARIHLHLNHLDEAYKYFNFISINLNQNSAYEMEKYLALLGLAHICRLQKKNDEALNHLNAAFAVLQQSSAMSIYAQYYWQEKADLDKAKGDETGLKNTLETLEKLKTNKGFNMVDYENWKKTLNLQS